MIRSPWAVILIIAGALIAYLANAIGLWWAGYLIGMVLAIWLRPSLAGLAVLLGWGVGFVQGAVGAHLLGSVRVVALLAGLPAGLGFMLVVIALVLAFLEGWLPALLVHRLLAIRARSRAVSS
jgi:hypothetical protein